MSNDDSKKKNTRYLALLIVNTVLFFSLYRILLNFAEMSQQTFPSFVVMVVYMALLLGFVLAYLIYNRFFYREGITVEQLSPLWSEEQKNDFIEDAKRRKARSKWMLLIIFPLVVTFMVDAFDLFVIDTFFR